MALRAVVDTNVLVSALLKPASLPAAVVQTIRHDLLVPVVCAEILHEYEAVLHRPRLGLDGHDVTELLDLVHAQGRWVHIQPAPPFELPDPGDWPFMAVALAANCPVITGNARDFPKRFGVEAVSARQWMDRSGGLPARR